MQNGTEKKEWGGAHVHLLRRFPEMTVKTHHVAMPS